MFSGWRQTSTNHHDLRRYIIDGKFIRKLKAEANLTYKTDGMDDKDVSWVSPQQLCDAATQLREAVRTGSPETRIILEIYERNANRIDSLAQGLSAT